MNLKWWHRAMFALAAVAASAVAGFALLKHRNDGVAVAGLFGVALIAVVMATVGRVPETFKIAGAEVGKFTEDVKQATQGLPLQAAVDFVAHLPDTPALAPITREVRNRAIRHEKLARAVEALGYRWEPATVPEDVDRGVEGIAFGSEHAGEVIFLSRMMSTYVGIAWMSRAPNVLWIADEAHGPPSTDPAALLRAIKEVGEGRAWYIARWPLDPFDLREGLSKVVGPARTCLGE